MIHLVPVVAFDLTENEMELLARSAEIAYDGTRGVDYVRLWAQRRLGLFRFQNGPEGLFAFVVDKDVFRIVFVGGKNLIKHAEQILKDVNELKAYYDCSVLECFTTDTKMVRLYEKLGFKKVATVMRLI